MIVAEKNRADSVELSSEKIANGEAFFNRGDINSAVDAFRSVLEFDPENTRANSNLGVVLWQTGDRDSALDYLIRGYNADQDDKIALTNLAQVYLTVGKEQEALHLYNEFLDRHPNEDEIRNILKALNAQQATDTGPEGSLEQQLLARAEELQASDKADEALKILDAALTLSREPLTIHRKIAEFCRHSGQKGKAIEHLTKAYCLDSFDKTTAVSLSTLLYNSGMYEATIHTCSTYLSLQAEDPEIIELLVKCQALDSKRKAAASIDAATVDTGRTLIERVPEMDNVLDALSELGVEVKAILDVGVLRGTPQLMKKFPDLKHYLFEPIDDHFDQIRRNYSSLNYELIHVALSSKDGEAWQHNLCNDGSGRITHSQIADKPGDPEKDPFLIKSQQVPMARLDTLMEGMDVATPYLLKLDVDGHEIPILEGARETLKNANVVVIEATARTFLDRANFLANEGFVLFDIVDFAYYSGVLHQVDIIFIRKELRDSNERLSPMKNLAFKASHWYQVSANWFSK